MYTVTIDFDPEREEFLAVMDQAGNYLEVDGVGDSIASALADLAANLEAREL